VIRNVNRQWCNVIKMIAFQPAIWNLDFQNSMHLCQLMSRVCSCVDLTHSTVISTLSSVRSLEISHALCRFRRICYCIYTLRNATAKLIISSPLCVRPYVRPQCITYWDKLEGFFDKFSRLFMCFERMIKICNNRILELYGCLSFRPSVCPHESIVLFLNGFLWNVFKYL